MNSNSFGDLTRRDAERHILVAVDESENSKRAVMYLADFFTECTDVFVTLLTIIPEPSEDFFPTKAEREEWLKRKKEAMRKKLEDYRQILLSGSFREGQIETELSVRQCTSIADAILEEQDKLRCCIVVVGRRGISHNEEFVFGSTSNGILHHARNCAVMVIE
jgi:nucleotide-binding universal stress UspA family protein